MTVDPNDPSSYTMGSNLTDINIPVGQKLEAQATSLAGPMDRTALISEALKALIERESARRLARLGGSQPALQAAPRRREDQPA